MAKDKAPPRYLMPGDDPKVDEVLARLRKDGEDGDPLYVDYRKRRRERLRQDPSSAAPAVPESAVGASEAAMPLVPEAARAQAVTTDRLAEPQPVALPAPPAWNALPRAASKGTRPQATPRWLLWGAFAITAPIVAIVIGLRVVAPARAWNSDRSRERHRGRCTARECGGERARRRHDGGSGPFRERAGGAERERNGSDVAGEATRQASPGTG